MLAVGTGIAPMAQIIQTVLNNEEDETMVTLLYGCKTYQDILLKTEIDDWSRYWNFTCTYFLSQEPEFESKVAYKYGDKVIQSRITCHTVHTVIPDEQDNFLVLICGTRSFEQDMIKCMTELNVTEQKYHKFWWKQKGKTKQKKWICKTALHFDFIFRVCHTYHKLIMADIWNIDNGQKHLNSFVMALSLNIWKIGRATCIVLAPVNFLHACWYLLNNKGMDWNFTHLFSAVIKLERHRSITLSNFSTELCPFSYCHALRIVNWGLTNSSCFLWLYLENISHFKEKIIERNSNECNVIIIFSD